MSKINFVTLLFFILNIQNAIGKNEDYIGVVYWRGFDIESITGIPESQGSDSNLLIVFYVQIMPDDLVMQLHR
ncbi:hypothetical protein P2Q59_20620, partial [Escherichia coli]